MCGRYVLAGDPAAYADYFGAMPTPTEALEPSYNVAPTDPVYAVAEWNEERLLGQMKWGLVPHWAKDAKKPAINARIETVATAPMFRDSFARKRCLIPADGFYEWEPKDRGRAPHWFYRADGFPLALAGIWSTWKDPETGLLARTCAIITTKSTGVVSPIHGRMPFLLDESSWDAWLDRTVTDGEEIRAQMAPVGEDLLMEHEVSREVNNVRNNGASLTDPAAGTLDP